MLLYILYIYMFQLVDLVLINFFFKFDVVWVQVCVCAKYIMLKEEQTNCVVFLFSSKTISLLCQISQEQEQEGS